MPAAGAGDPTDSLAAIACANCGAALERRYCPECGERRPDARDRSLVGLLHEAAATFSPVDGTIVRTLHALFTKPGLLTAEYFAGRRMRYTRPLAFFLAINLAFFLILPHTGLLRYHLRDFMQVSSLEPFVPAGGYSGATQAVARHLAASHESFAALEARFEPELVEKKKSMLIFSIPVFAVILQLMYARRRRLFAEHLVFSLHTYAFYLAFMGFGLTGLFTVVFLALRAIGPRTAPLVSALSTEGALMVALFSGLGAYLYRAVRRVYGEDAGRALATALALVVAMQGIVVLYRTALLWATLWSVGAWSPFG